MDLSSVIFTVVYIIEDAMRRDTAAPDKFCAFVSIDSGLWKISESLEFSYLRSLAFGFCQFLAALGIFSKLCF